MIRVVTIGRLLNGLGLLCSVTAVLTVLYYWDPTRALIKRMHPDSELRYEQIPPPMSTLSPVDGLTIRSTEQSEEIRRRLLLSAFGTGKVPTHLRPRMIRRNVDKNPGAVHTCLSAQGPAVVHLLSRLRTEIMRALGCEAAFYSGWENLAGIDELADYLSKNQPYTIGYFRPIQSNRKLIVYHHGLAGTYHDQHRLIEKWVKAGYTVAALNMPGYGDNTCYDYKRYCGIAPLGGRFASPLALALVPPVVAINHAMAQEEFSYIAMVGLSSGAWITLVTAAMDDRINLSVPVAGVLPVSMLMGKESSAREFIHPLSQAASVLDLAALGADRTGRSQIQIFNKFDRCCFYGIRPTLYAAALSDRVEELGGRLDIMLDETHARHKISTWAADRIGAALEEGALR